jgi:hypothetical protein
VNRIDLADGTYLTGASMGSMTLFPEERVVSVSIVDAVATLTTNGPEPEVVARVAVVKSDRGSSPKRSKTVAAHNEPQPFRRSDDAKRWTTLNEFEDCVARHLTPAEQIVWHHLFRHCRDGRSSVSTRRMAESLGLAPNTTTAALQWLKARRLVWEIVKSTHRGASSVYGLHQNPGRLADGCAAANAPRLSRRNRTPPRRPKPR